ncbi:ArsR family transcriptional regulator [Ktedonosporobacter rubrisoli]|uniref:ArsR family transcriptional regulator n=1 Tax=Ktedonosporobacter rubrisoli TaxID=2509675 RepID=A0A4P6JK39_KTERU|nr:winged helix-turn-helix domain-containing protein [Ktedonosporobacter rubrisoli]QBD75413.1 ArsR family transcriptional regulator [Ktedonosporobacter rubrisoli]
MQELYRIENLEQLRAIADVLRTHILELLREHPMTVKQVADRLKLASARVHYHVRELEKVGLLRLVETREKGGILEKYYQSVAHTFWVPPDLLLSIPANAVLPTMADWLEQTQQRFLEALLKELEQQDRPPNFGWGETQVYMTPEEMKRVFNQMLKLLEPYQVPRGIEGEQEVVSTLLMYPSSGKELPIDIPDSTQFHPGKEDTKEKFS